MLPAELVYLRRIPFDVALVGPPLDDPGVQICVDLGHHLAKHHHVRLEGLGALALPVGEELVAEVELVRSEEILVDLLPLTVTDCFIVLRFAFS